MLQDCLVCLWHVYTIYLMGTAEAGRAQVLSDKSTDAVGAAESKLSTENDGPSLGARLTSAREGRQVSLIEAVKQTRIPEHYVRMMENNDYSLLSDQIYVMPFLRRYATFLGLDPEEVAMRFVRAVQHADSAPTARGIEPIEMDRPKGRNWNRPAIAAGLIGIIVVAWIAQSHLRSHAPVGVGATSGSAQTSTSP
jgi:hypothetical protein